MKDKKDTKFSTVLIGVLILVIITAIVSCAGGSGSGRRNNKSYAEQYGYSVEDFYHKGSDGKWYLN